MTSLASIKKDFVVLQRIQNGEVLWVDKALLLICLKGDGLGEDQELAHS